LNLKDDVEKLISFSKENDINWIITDNYEINKEYIKKIKDEKFKVLSIDDTAKIHYFSDIVLNQNIGAEKLNISAEKYTKFLLGPKYVMIQDELLKKNKKSVSEIKKILITLGGSDQDNLTLKLLKILELVNEDVEFLAVVGPFNPFYEIIKKYVKESDCKIKLIKSPDNMAEVYLEADIAISAGGSSCYELAYFGIPNLIITIADNQLNIAHELDKQNVAIYIGRKNELKEGYLRDNVKELLNNHHLRKRMSQNGRKIVDGKGKERVVDFMEINN